MVTKPVKRFCISHGQKVFLASAIMGYFYAKDPGDFKRDSRAGAGTGLMEPPFQPTPYQYKRVSRPTNSLELLAKLATDSFSVEVLNVAPPVEKENFKPTHYEYDSMERTIKL